MLNSEKGRALVDGLPDNRILTETDGPFTSIGDRPSVPRDVGLVIDELAKLKSKSSELLAESVFSNMKKLCGTY